MTLWWIGIAVLALVVAPVAVVLLKEVLSQVRQLNRLADDLLEHGVALTGDLDALPRLVKTKEAASSTRELVEGYSSTLLRLLGARSADTRGE